ncbi:hypothetical protein HHI36_012789 [Cryptolaemus montrouzieri]|uniref:Uncharacterized protein n=1 Tax=Cryptolaemus montrouzieri TaxID=559131 RepID=A0ABD2NFE0_9CUCU
MYLVKIPEINNVIWKRHLNQIRNVYSANSNSPSVTSHDEESMSAEVSEVEDRIDDRVNVSVKHYKDSESAYLLRPRNEIKPVERLTFDDL